MAEVISTATTAHPCKCCGLQIAGYYCRSLLGGGRFMGFAEFNGPNTTPEKWYRRGIIEGAISCEIAGNTWSFTATSITAFFELCRFDPPGLTWQVVDTPAELISCTPSCKTGYCRGADRGEFKINSIGNAAGTASLDTDGLAMFNGDANTVITAKKITYNTLYYNGFPRTTSGSISGRLELECTMDDAFLYPTCNGLPENVEGGECRAYTTYLDNNYNTTNYQKIEGQSCVIFVTLVNASVGGSVHVEAQLLETEHPIGTIISEYIIELDLTAPNSAFVLRIDIPTPAVGRAIELTGLTASTGGSGGSLTFEPESGAYRVDD